MSSSSTRLTFCKCGSAAPIHPQNTTKLGSSGRVSSGVAGERKIFGATWTSGGRKGGRALGAGEGEGEDDMRAGERG